MTAEEKPYLFRPYVLSDIPFIQSSWGTSYHDGVNGHKLITPEEFHSYHRPIREKILNKPNIAVIVCASKDDNDLIIGYSIVEKPKESHGVLLHYLYVKQAFKGQQIATELLAKSISEKPVLYTHSTIAAGRIIYKYKLKGKEEFERFLFCPHLI